MNFRSAARLLGSGRTVYSCNCGTLSQFPTNRSIVPAYSVRLITMGAARLSAASVASTGTLEQTGRASVFLC